MAKRRSLEANLPTTKGLRDCQPQAGPPHSRPPTLLLHRRRLAWILFPGDFWIHPVRLWGDFSPLSGVTMAKQVIDIVLSGKELATDLGFWESLHLSPFLTSSDDC